MTPADFRPTHVVPQDGLPAWEAPDVERPTTPLDALLPVQLVDRLGDWGRIVCANGWSAWVDGRLLLAVPRDPPGASGPLTRTADPRPLLTRTEDALGRYRRAVEELAGGGDGESFRRGTHGLRVGVVVEGESLWLYDADHERWVYCDGTRLSTYAATEGPATDGHGDDHEAADPPRAAATGPGASPPPDEEPTRLVPAAQEPTDGTDGSTAGMGPGETQVVNEVAGPEPTRVVGEAVGPEPTRVVGEAVGPGETQVVDELHTPEPHTPHGGHPAPFLPPERDEPDQPLRPGDA
ncbi:hypothetical protein [Streptomyces sp. WAC 01529]|uniref:hypothetical protein n=1 Tax=Streptomyces sp. WAC 01529 TaxID=2203205 RepID=UPI001F0B7662|nr:hypothetical protein [Streptomyces sp. WAC 01529]